MGLKKYEFLYSLCCSCSHLLCFSPIKNINVFKKPPVSNSNGDKINDRHININIYDKSVQIKLTTVNIK